MWGETKNITLSLLGINFLKKTVNIYDVIFPHLLMNSRDMMLLLTSEHCHRYMIRCWQVKQYFFNIMFLKYIKYLQDE
jgi:hypothetical protein